MIPAFLTFTLHTRFTEVWSGFLLSSLAMRVHFDPNGHPEKAARLCFQMGILRMCWE